ncbi:MAG: rhomboid family intramembrane serine protease [Aquificae bacterium]|nr:rhomboid family intramembrane serine protease [Aquificota bacterium]
MIPIKDNVPTRRKPILTITLIIINVLVFLYEVSLPPEELDLFIHRYGLLPADILHLNLLPLITHMFLHGSWAHLFGNMIFLWVFGNNVEDALGRIKFIIFYIVSGLGAAFLQSFVSILAGNLFIPMVGASGAISGILAAYMKLYPEAKVLTIIPPFFFTAFVLPAWFFIGYWFFIQVLFALITPPTMGGVAWYAHVGGFITGWYFLDLIYKPKQMKVVHYSTLR